MTFLNLLGHDELAVLLRLVDLVGIGDFVRLRFVDSLLFNLDLLLGLGNLGE